ncbi:hypothetical protein TWF173_006408 [Orbilia oligospora]|nr:hypothetical protein TWF173_006408 [Orbilia oligospora]
MSHWLNRPWQIKERPYMMCEMKPKQLLLKITIRGSDEIEGVSDPRWSMNRDYPGPFVLHVSYEEDPRTWHHALPNIILVPIMGLHYPTASDHLMINNPFAL